MNQPINRLLEVLEYSEKEDNGPKQRAHFEKLVKHALETVPFYQYFYQGKSTHPLPILTREHIQEAGDDFISTQIPSAHGNRYPLATSGSTGKTVNVLATDFTKLFYDALMLREHRWHKRDFSKTLMSIRWAKKDFAPAPSGHYQPNWGYPINQYRNTGPSIFVNVTSPTVLQIEGILHYQPHIINSYPSQLAALAHYCIQKNLSLPFIEEIRTTGETFSDSYKNVIQTAWPQVKITDTYSCVEIGSIAQQCAEFQNYHINSEHVYLEIVDDNGNPCLLGVQGRILVTSLLNYATPMIRYEIGDYAMWGKCNCGRSLPVITKILGRKRNRLILPNGESFFPYLGERSDVHKITDATIKFQFVQHSVNEVELKMVVSKPLTAWQEEQLKLLHRKNLGSHFSIAITYHDDIPAGPNGKFEEFISLVSL